MMNNRFGIIYLKSGKEQVKTMWILFIAVLMQQVPLTSMAYTYSEAVRLRNTLLFDYERHARPDDVTSVQVGFQLISVNSLDWRQQALSATGWFTVVWTNTALGWTANNYGGVTSLHFFEGEIWRPDIVIENTVDYVGPVVEEQLHYRSLESGVTVWELPVQFKVHCDMDMTYYPFDRHKCSMVVSSWSYSASEVELSPLSSVVGLDKYVENSAWELSSDPLIKATSETRTVSAETRTYSKLTFEFELTRRRDFHGMVIFLPLVILNILSMLVFILPVETGEKSGYCVAILLAIVLMFTVYYDDLPVARYLPIIDVYVILVFILAALCIVCSVVVLYLHHHDTSEPLSPLMVSVGLFLQEITCSRKKDNNEDHDDSWQVQEQPNIEETTTGNGIPNWSKPRSQSQEELPNGHAPIASTLPRRTLTPIERNRVRPRSNISRKANPSINSSSFHTESLDDPITWKGISKQFNKLCVVVSIVLSFLVHFVFIVTIAVGGSVT